jgi:Predicted nucleic acid-binding protein, contains PIN domain
MRYLLDTNIVSDMMRNPQGAVFAHIERVGEECVFTSIIVTAELRFGVEKRKSLKLAQRLEMILMRLPVEGFSAPVDEHYGRCRATLASAGQPIGDMDMLIAAHALALDAVLVTNNESEFSRVPGLKVENWLR